MKEFALTLTEQDLSVINAALQEMPLRLAAPVVMKINQQLDACAKSSGEHNPDAQRTAP